MTGLIDPFVHFAAHLRAKILWNKLYEIGPWSCWLVTEKVIGKPFPFMYMYVCVFLTTSKTFVKT